MYYYNIWLSYGALVALIKYLLLWSDIIFPVPPDVDLYQQLGPPIFVLLVVQLFYSERDKYNYYRVSQYSYSHEVTR